MFSRFFILLMTLSFVACSQPKYDDPTRTPAVNDLGTCDIQFVNSKICMDLIWEKKPTETDFGSFVLEFYNPDDRSLFIDPASTPQVTVWMPSMGHGSSPVTVEKLSTGQYRVSKVFFTMHGDWEIQVKILDNGTDQVTVPVRF